jgi:hypothetical protein
VRNKVTASDSSIFPSPRRSWLQRVGATWPFDVRTSHRPSNSPLPPQLVRPVVGDGPLGAYLAWCALVGFAGVQPFVLAALLRQTTSLGAAASTEVRMLTWTLPVVAGARVLDWLWGRRGDA